jgi:hypothetical protein
MDKTLDVKKLKIKQAVGKREKFTKGRASFFWSTIFAVDF